MKKKADEIIVQGKSYSLNGTETNFLKLTIEQKMVREARTNGKSFWEIPEDKHRHITDSIILAMAAITGAKMPNTELLAKYISDEMIRFIYDFGYEEYTAEEFISAMRINMLPTIKNAGGANLIIKKLPKRVCVSFLADVMQNYRLIRTMIDRMVENKVNGY